MCSYQLLALVPSFLARLFLRCASYLSPFVVLLGVLVLISVIIVIMVVKSEVSCASFVLS